MKPIRRAFLLLTAATLLFANPASAADADPKPEGRVVAASSAGCSARYCAR